MGLKSLGFTVAQASEFEWPSTFFDQERNILMVGEYIYLRDASMAEQSALQEIHLDGYGDENFADVKDQIRNREGHWPIGPFRSRLDLAYAYLRDPSKGTHMRKWYDVWFSIDSFAVDLSAWQSEGYVRNIIAIARELESTNNATPIQQLSFARQNATGFAELDISRQYLHTILGESTSDSTLSRPSVAGRYVAFSETHTVSGRTHAILHDTVTGSVNALGGTYPSHVSSNQLFVRVASLGGAASGMAVVFWIDTLGNASTAKGLPLAHDTTLNLLELPRRKTHELRGSDFDFLGHRATEGYLWNALLTSTRLFLQICTAEDWVADVSCELMSCSVSDGCGSLSSLLSTEEGQRLRLHDASNETLLYFLDETMHIIVDAEGVSDQMPAINLACEFTQETSTGLVAATLYRDMLAGVYLNGTVFSFDLDKDNDGIIDGHDAFPYDGIEAFDSDNDSIGDKTDLVNYTMRSCATSADLGACTSDLVVLYSVFFFWFFAAIVVCRKLTKGTWDLYEAVLQGIHYEVFVRHQEELEAAKRAEIEAKKERELASPKKNRMRGETYATLATRSISTKSLSDGASQSIPVLGAPQLANPNGDQGVLDVETKRDVLFRFRRCPEMLELKEMAADILADQEGASTVLPAYLQKCFLLVEKIMLERHTTISLFVDVLRALIDIFAVISVAVAFTTVSYSHVYQLDADSRRLHARLQWLDWWISGGFLARFVLERFGSEAFQLGRMRTRPWIEILAIVTMPPGLKEYMSDVYMVTQALRCLIVFRVYRAYHRFFMEKQLVHVLINSPDYFLGALIIGFMILCAAAVAQFESETDPSGLADFQISLWFSAVTITTVGYGDYAPLSQLGRLLAIFMMIFGVGLVGTISGSVAKAIQTVGSTEEKVKQLKADNRTRYEQYKEVFDLASLAYNPVLMSVAPVFIRGELRMRAMVAANKRAATAAADPGSPMNANLLRSSVNSMWPEARFRQRHSSTTSSSSDGTAITTTTFFSGSSGQSAPVVSANFPISLVVGDLIASNTAWRNGSTLSKTAAHVPPRRKEAAMEKLLAHIEDRGGGCPPKVRVLLLLQSFQIDGRHKMPNFAEFVSSLTRIICEPLRQNVCVLEKAFALAEDARHHSKHVGHSSTRDLHGRHRGPRVPDLERYSIADPLDEKLEKMERLLSDPQYQLLKRVDFALLHSELTLIVLEFERLEMVQWGFENLVPRKGARIPTAQHISQERYSQVKSYIGSLSEGDVQMSPEDFVDHMETEAGLRKIPTGSKFAIRVRRALERMKSNPGILQTEQENPRASQGVSGSSSGHREPRRRSVLGRLFIGALGSPTSRSGPGATVAPLPPGMPMPKTNPLSAFHQVTTLARARERIMRQSILTRENPDTDEESDRDHDPSTSAKVSPETKDSDSKGDAGVAPIESGTIDAESAQQAAATPAQDGDEDGPATSVKTSPLLMREARDSIINLDVMQLETAENEDVEVLSRIDSEEDKAEGSDTAPKEDEF